MDFQTSIDTTHFSNTGTSSPTNFDDFIPEVYRIKNSCKGRLIQTKMEVEDYFSSDYSDMESQVEVKQEKLEYDERRPKSRYRKDKPFKCSFCSFVTAWKCNIIRHRQQHTREKVYGCHLCSYTALQKSNLRTHIRIHMGDKKFVCNFCDYKTMYKSTLDMHLLKHTRQNRQKDLKKYKNSKQIGCDEQTTRDAHTDEKNCKQELCDAVKAEESAQELDIEESAWNLSLTTQLDELNSPLDLKIVNRTSSETKTNVEELKPECSEWDLTTPEDADVKIVELKCVENHEYKEDLETPEPQWDLSLTAQLDHINDDEMDVKIVEPPCNKLKIEESQWDLTTQIDQLNSEEVNVKVVELKPSEVDL